MLSVIIPTYNEENNIIECLKRINLIKKKIELFIIVVDDNSNDRTHELLIKKQFLYDQLIINEKNYGKGGCIIKTLKYISSKYTIIQDADLEYNPNDIIYIYKELMNNKVVYGSRLLKLSQNRFNSNIRIYGNKVLTTISNFFNKQNLTDAHTCYKAMETDILKSLNIVSNGFEVCVEINTKLANKNIKIIEIPISYTGRNYKDGKKIKTIDFFRAILSIIKFKYFNKIC